MSYPVLVTLHLFAAIVFVGTVFFEVLILGGVRRRVRPDAMKEVEQAIGRRLRRFMPWVLFVLYSAGLGLAWHYRAVLASPFQSSLGTLLAIKIVLAISVAAHFVRAITWLAKGRMTARRYRFIHVSVFCHVIAIALIAKTMFHAG